MINKTVLLEKIEKKRAEYTADHKAFDFELMDKLGVLNDIVEIVENL
jgi:hypothetical protein